MTQEEKELLLRDLCARLRYGIVINTGDKDLKLDRKHQCIGVLYPEDCSDEFNERNNNASFYITISGCYYGEEIKPYLRPMSSMTEEEEDSLAELNCYYDNKGLYFSCGHSQNDICDVINFLNSHYFDYRGLILMGLALEAPEGMYNIKEQ